MKAGLRFLVLFSTLGLSFFGLNAQITNSALSSGSWYKVAVTESGVYKLSYEFLKQHNIISGPTELSKIKVHGFGGMLPEARSQQRPTDLPSLPLYAQAGNDAILQAGEYILFYAQGPHTVPFNPETGWFEPQYNIYSDKAYYFITLNNSPSVALITDPAGAIKTTILTSYEAYFWHKPQEVNLLQSGRQWFGDALGYQTSKEYPLPFEGFSGTRLKMKGRYVNGAKQPVIINTSINSQGNQSVYLSQTYDGQYNQKGTATDFSYNFSPVGLAANTSLTYKTTVETKLNANETYLDYFLVQAACATQFSGSAKTMVFTEVAGGGSSISIASPNANTQIWNVSEPLRPRLQNSDFNGQAHRFTYTGEVPTFQVVDPAKAAAPTFVSSIANQNITSNPQAELVIVAVPETIGQAERLANFRRTNDGLNVQVVLLEEIYNEFSSGRPDLTAIRDYAAKLYHTGDALKYLLLFGRGHFDYKNIKGQALSRIPIYESYNSFSPTASYASDDYLGFLENEEGNWLENEAGNQTLEIGIGRLPVIDANEARIVVDKLIRYSSIAATAGEWKSKIAFVADDEDNNTHLRDADELSALVNQLAPFYTTDKYYVDAFPQVASANGKTSPQCAQALQEAIESGVFVLNYSGHGSREYWTQERILSKGMVSVLKNTQKLPIVVTATCDFGEHDGNIRSGGEEFLLNEWGGGIGLLTTSRPVFSNTNLKINKAFYQYFLSDTLTSLRLGDIIRLAKNLSTPNTGVNNRNFILLGDPSMMPAYPKQNISLSQMVNLTGPQETWRAHDQVKLSGQVNSAKGTLNTTFSGTVEFTLLDKPYTKTTLGYGSNQAKNYLVQDNALFKGRAAVKNGKFDLQFTLPKHIRYDLARGKIVMYAVNSDSTQDASGVNQEVLIGGSGNLLSDNTAPKMEAYLNNTAFTNGQRVPQFSALVVSLSDEYGINISKNSIGQSLTATLNDSLVVDLSSEYWAIGNNFSTGQVTYTLPELPYGGHKLRVEAWDLNDNKTSQVLEFVVAEKPAIGLSNLTLVPNPAVATSKLILEHNRPGEDLELNFAVINTTGQEIIQASMDYNGAPSTILVDGVLAGANKLLPGVYVLRARLRCITDHSITEKTKKFIILH